MKLLIKVIVIVLPFFFTACNDDKVGYIDVNKLYESFEYKKILTEDFNRIKSARKRIVDSLDFELNKLLNEMEKSSQVNKESEQIFEKKQKDLYQIEKQYDEDNQVLINSYNEKIIKQLNAYIKEYGQNESYKLILGADNKGGLLYADEKLNVTEKVIIYVNERYRGGKDK